MIFISYLLLVSLISALGIFTISTFYRQAFENDHPLDNFNALFWFGVAIVLSIIVIGCLVIIGMELKTL